MGCFYWQSRCSYVAWRPVKNESNYRTTLPVADMEQAACHESLGAQEMPRFDSPVHIHVTSYRKRLTDTDGVSAKAALDGIVALGILANDTAKQVQKISFENRKATDEEKTIIEITEAG